MGASLQLLPAPPSPPPEPIFIHPRIKISHFPPVLASLGSIGCTLLTSPALSPWLGIPGDQSQPWPGWRRMPANPRAAGLLWNSNQLQGKASAPCQGCQSSPAPPTPLLVYLGVNNHLHLFKQKMSCKISICSCFFSSGEFQLLICREMGRSAQFEGNCASFWLFQFHKLSGIQIAAAQHSSPVSHSLSSAAAWGLREKTCTKHPKIPSWELWAAILSFRASPRAPRAAERSRN